MELTKHSTPFVIGVLYDGFPEDAVVAFCTDPPPGLTFEPDRLHRRMGAPLPFSTLIMLVAGGVVALKIIAGGFFDELGRPLGKHLGKLLRDRAVQLFRRRQRVSAEFIIWIDHDGPCWIQLLVQVRRENDLLAMIAALPDVLPVVERTLEEYRGRTLTNIFLRYDPESRVWLRDLVFIDDKMLPGNLLRTQPPDAAGVNAET